MNQLKKPSWMEEFQKFLLRGNVLDLAVGMVIGSAFTAIVTALVDSVINPLLSLIIGGIDFSGVTVGPFPIGGLIMAVIRFVAIAFVLFWMVKIVNSLRRKKDEPAPEPDPEPSPEEKLLTEIRDLLKEGK